MAIRCSSCDREIPAADVSLESGLAKCTACNAVFRFADQVEGGGVRRPREEIALPKRFTLEDVGGDLRITRRWFSPVAYFLVFFCLFWDGFLVVWYAIAFLANGPLIMKIFPILHVAVGLGLTYFTAALFLNRTVIHVGDRAYQITHAPLPWWGQRAGNVDDIDQVYVVEALRSNKGSISRTYSVLARMQGGAKDTFVSGLDDFDQALFIEQEIERYLGIEDRPVPGEVAR